MMHEVSIINHPVGQEVPKARGKIITVFFFNIVGEKMVAISKSLPSGHNGLDIIGIAINYYNI